MKKLVPFSLLTLVVAVIAVTAPGCRMEHEKNDRMDRLENRVTAIEAKLDMMHKP
jgi:hypothetical protein